jgi:hypothetical protein
LLEGGHYVWFAKLIVAAELLVGIALILAARYRQHQPGAVHHSHFADPGLEDRRMDRSRPGLAAAARHSLAARKDIRKRSGSRNRKRINKLIPPIINKIR